MKGLSRNQICKPGQGIMPFQISIKVVEARRHRKLFMRGVGIPEAAVTIDSGGIVAFRRARLRPEVKQMA